MKEEKSCKTIVFLGKEKYDIAWYLLELAARRGFKILVIDNSVAGRLFDWYAKGSDDTVEGINLTVTKGRKTTVEKAVSDYDYIFYYYGRNYDGFRVKADHYIIAETTERYVENELVKQGVGFEAKPYIIVRECVLKTGVVKSFIENTGFDAIQTFILPLDYDDERHYMSLARGGIKTAAKLSQDMKDTLSFLMNTIFGVPERELKKDFKAIGGR